MQNIPLIVDVVPQTNGNIQSQTIQINGGAVSSKDTASAEPVKSAEPPLQPKDVKIEFDNKLLEDSMMYLYVDIPEKIQSKFHHSGSKMIRRFLVILNSLIGAKSTLNYHIREVEKYEITIPMNIHTDKDAKENTIDFINGKINTLKTFLKDINWKALAISQLREVRDAKNTYGKLFDSFKLKVHTPNIMFSYDEPIEIKHPVLETVDVHREFLVDKSTILYISDPYIEDYGFFMNLSVTFDEMGFGYNYLHLYEHLMTRSWDDLDEKYVIDMNGSTWPNATCYIYNIHSTQESLNEHAAASIKWSIDSRKDDFWKTKMDVIDVETNRTISETRTDRSMNSMARSDYRAYEQGYDLNVFDYWSNKPFDMMIIGPKKVDELKLKHENINKAITRTPLRNIPRPANVKFDFIPLDVLKSKMMQDTYTKRITPDKLRSDILNKKSSKGVVGSDCIFYARNEDLSEMNCILLPLLFANRMFDVKELIQIIEGVKMPLSCSDLYSTPLVVATAEPIYYTV
jgi:hypothetical protein